MILSICIPTYNREKEIQRTLDCLLKQINDDIEVIVSDNASTDQTSEIIKKYPVRYYRNITNLGYDRNVDQCLKLAQGDFVWLLNSDELLKADAVKIVLQNIKKYPEVAWICIDNEMKGRRYGLYRTGREFIKQNGLVGGLMSQNIFNRRHLPEDKSKYYGNLWIHYSLALEITADKQILFIENLFVPQAAPCQWAKGGRAFYTYINLKRIVESNKYDINFAWGFPKVLLSAKKRGLRFTRERAKTIIKEFAKNPFIMILSLLILSIPILQHENIDL